MRSVIVVVANPSIQILLQLLQAGVDLLAEGDLIKLLQDRLMEALTDPIGLRVTSFVFCMLDIAF